MARSVDFHELGDVSAIVERVEQLRDDIADSILANGINASGATIRSLRVESHADADSLRVTLYGRPFFNAIETGSSRWTGRTGIRCTVDEFTEIIRQWASDKGLVFDDEDRAVSAIAWAIIKRGSKTKREGGRADIYTPLVDGAAADIGELVGLFFSERINALLINWKNS